MISISTRSGGTCTGAPALLPGRPSVVMIADCTHCKNAQCLAKLCARLKAVFGTACSYDTVR